MSFMTSISLQIHCWVCWWKDFENRSTFFDSRGQSPEFCATL